VKTLTRPPSYGFVAPARRLDERQVAEQLLGALEQQSPMRANPETMRGGWYHRSRYDMKAARSRRARSPCGR